MSETLRISVGAEPERASLTGRFVDGVSAALRPVRVDFDDENRQLVLIAAGEVLAEWPYDDLRLLSDQAGEDQVILRLAGTGAARVLLQGEDAARLVRSRAPYRQRHVSHVRRGMILAWAGAALAAVALILLVLVPFIANQLAAFLPPRGEKALGDATFEQIRSALDETGFGLPICEDAEGLAALQVIEDRLTEGLELETELTVHVLAHPMVNAFALPGGYVVFFDGLIQSAETPEEVAAVFAHEIGHVEARDPTRIALRSAGSIGVLGLLFGDFAGGALVLFLTERIIQAKYTQEAEAAADSYAYGALLKAGLPPSAIATFFERLAGAGEDEGILQHFLSHPAMGDRIAASRAATPVGFEARPLLTEEEWAALRAICDGAAFPYLYP